MFNKGMLRRLVTIALLPVLVGLFVFYGRRSRVDDMLLLWQPALERFTLPPLENSSPLSVPPESLCKQKSPLPQEGAQAWFINPTPRYGETVWLCVRLTLNGVATWAEVNATTYYQTDTNQMRQGGSGTWEVGREGVRALNFQYLDAKPNTPISITVNLYEYEHPVKPYTTYIAYTQPAEPFPYRTQLRKALSLIYLVIRHTVTPLAVERYPWFSGTALSGWLLILAGFIVNRRYRLDQSSHENFKWNRMTLHIACVSLSFSYLLILVHFMRANTFPYSANPLEIRNGEQRLILNFIVQLFSAGLIWWKLRDSSKCVNVIQLRTILSLTLLAVLASIVVNMVYNTSLCCENPLATFWGFPFSWLVGIAQEPPFDRFDHWTTFAYLSHFAGRMRWWINPWKFVADFLFWWAIVVSFGLLLTQKIRQQ